LIGRTISHYRLAELIGAGGLGTVYKADDLRLERGVAVKALTPASTNPTAIKRFRREAKIISKIDHPNVVTLHDIVDVGGMSFYIMEYIDGPTLRDRMSEELELPEIIHIAREVGAGLQAAHELGVVHRDVKPENIMIAKSGVCKVLDFSMALLADATRITAAGHVVGTVHYMAPEQVQGKVIDARADIYALGVVAYEMLAGRRPFEAKEWEALRYQITTENPQWLTDIVPGMREDVEAVVHKALEKEPADRYRSMDQMLHDLGVVALRLESESSGGAQMHASPRPR
jgi:serine/threonine-protein kinase